MAKKQILKLAQREATIGTNISTNRELHGDEKVPRKDIPLTTMIDRKELCSLLREPYAGESLFNTADGKKHEPLFAGKIGPMPVLGKFEECDITIFVGIDLAEIHLNDCTLSTIRIEPQFGGMTRLKFTAGYHPGEEDAVSDLDNWLDQDVKLSMVIGKLKTVDEKQPELPMQTNAESAGEEVAPPVH